ncbi:MAG: class I SAM-dependent methyltransferase [Gemmataceae bacterium]
MDLAQLQALQTAEGQVLLAQAAELAPDESTFLACFNKLSKFASSGLTRAALETALLRRKARAKFRLADRMFFTREALEQASSEPVSRHRARRFTGLPCVADLCCGVGGDALALAEGTHVFAVDRDPLRLAMARLNVAAYGGISQATFLEGDVLHIGLPRLDGAFVDPDRRVGGRRTLSVHACQPPLPSLLTRLPRDIPIGVKLAPGVPLQELREFDAEAEFVSLGGELKECVLWPGPGRTATRRATLLPGSETLTAGEAALPPAGEPEGWLYDPDPAVVRAGLVAELAGQIGAKPLDASIAYLTSREPIDTPFAKRYAIAAAMPFHLHRLRDYLREHRVGRVQVTRRGSPVEPAEVERKLKLSGDEFRTVVLTRVLGRPFALIVRAG